MHIRMVLHMTGEKSYGPGGAAEPLGINPGTLGNLTKNREFPTAEWHEGGFVLP